MNVSTLIITGNEQEYIEGCLKRIVGKTDEIVVIDGGSTDETQDICRDYGCRVITNIFNFHFGDQRNFGIMECKGRWILQVDADEYLEEKVFDRLPEYTQQKDFDAYKFPRHNYLDGVLDKEHFPDYQIRLYRRYCRWIFPVHEELVGFKNLGELNFSIEHYKSKSRTEKQNSKYGFISKFYKDAIYDGEGVRVYEGDKGKDTR